MTEPRDEESPAAGAGADSGREVTELRDLLSRLAASSPLDIEFEITEEAETYRVELTGPDRERFVERRGEGLSALQVILGRVAAQHNYQKSIFVDSNGFRRGHEEELAEVAILSAAKVKKLGEAQTLRPMDPYERRLVHLALKDDPDVETHSEGEGFVKRITIHPRKK